MTHVTELRRWFFDLLSVRDTPLTLLLAWLTGESISAINDVSALCIHKPYVPVPSGHASEWVLSVGALLMYMHYADGGSVEDIERTIAVHTARRPHPADVEKACTGNMTRPRAVYGGGGEEERDATLSIWTRTASDFAPRMTFELDNSLTAPPIDVPAEISVLGRLGELRDDRLTQLCEVTRQWIRTLVAHYDEAARRSFQTHRASMQTHHASFKIDEHIETERQWERSECVAAALTAVTPQKVAECIVLYRDHVMQTMLGGKWATWSAESIGLPFAHWSLVTEPDNFVESPCVAPPIPDYNSLRKRRREARDAEDVGESSEPSTASPEIPTARHQPQSRHVPRFADRKDIAGMERLIATGWLADAENIEKVTAPQFREFVLDTKREVKNGPHLYRGRGLLPAHEYIQWIIKALDGRAHMYGAELTAQGKEWVDDFHVLTNPTGCPPWVLAAVVVSACVDGMLRVFANARDIWTAVEIAVLNNKKGGTLRRRILSVHGERISFPPIFLVTLARLCGGTIPVARLLAECRKGKRRCEMSEDKEDTSPSPLLQSSPPPPNEKEPYWQDMDDSCRDALTLELLMCNLHGMATFVNYITKSTSVPEWLGAYIKRLGTAFSTGASDVDAVRDVVTGLPSLARWFETYGTEVPTALSATEFLSRGIENGINTTAKFSQYTSDMLFTPPGLSWDAAVMIGTNFALYLRLGIRSILCNLVGLPFETATFLLREISTHEGRRRCANPALVSGLRRTHSAANAAYVDTIELVCKTIAEETS